MRDTFSLRSVSIGPRLALGYGIILMAVALLLAVSSWNTARSRTETFEALQSARQAAALSASLRSELLQAAVAVRNMGLVSDADGVNHHAKLAHQRRAAFVKALADLQAAAPGAEERAALGRLAEIDRRIEPLFKEAVGVQMAFNTEVAAKIIATQIDPLSELAVAELARIDQLLSTSAEAAMANADVAAAASDRWVLLAGLGVMLLAGGLGWRTTRSITRPLGQAEAATGHVARGDLSSPIEVTGHDESARLLASIRDMRDKLAVIVSGVRQGTDGIDLAAAEIASGNANLSVRTESQASALQQTRATMLDLTGSVKHTAALSGDAQRLSAQAAQTAAAGQQAVDSVVSTMAAIEDSSRRIVEINAVIDGIAFQTNILALNAAVEAARAGEHGRGFAVVASEVRALAHRTSAAAKEINSLINAAAVRAQGGTQLVQNAGQTMRAILDEVRRVNDIVVNISTSNRQQSDRLDEVDRVVGNIDNATQQNAALVEQAAAAAASMREQSQRLSEAVSTFRL